MITTKNLAEVYGVKDHKIRRILRKYCIKKKSMNRYYWWINEQDQELIYTILNKELKN